VIHKTLSNAITQALEVHNKYTVLKRSPEIISKLRAVEISSKGQYKILQSNRHIYEQSQVIGDRVHHKIDMNHKNLEGTDENLTMASNFIKEILLDFEAEGKLLADIALSRMDNINLFLKLSIDNDYIVRVNRLKTVMLLFNQMLINNPFNMSLYGMINRFLIQSHQRQIPINIRRFRLPSHLKLYLRLLEIHSASIPHIKGTCNCETINVEKPEKLLHDNKQLSDVVNNIYKRRISRLSWDLSQTSTIMETQSRLILYNLSLIKGMVNEIPRDDDGKPKVSDLNDEF